MSRASLFQPSPPDVAIEIDDAHVGIARVSGSGIVGNSVSEALPPGTVVPALSAANITDTAVVSRAISQAVARLGSRVGRVALVIPDTAAKVSLVRFETVPASITDLTELVRWQIRKSAPFPIEQAIVSFTPGATPAEGGHEFLVTMARADIVAEYEQACERAGLRVGLVDIATSNIINSVLAGSGAPAGDWLLVHATSGYVTLAVVRGEHVIFFRNREHDSNATLADVVHQTAMYYEDRIKGAGFNRVLLAGRAVQGVDEVRRSLEQRLEVRIEPVAQPELAALIGILTRERKAA